MSVVLFLNQSTASRRCVPMPPMVQSNGTSACTNESGRTFFFSLGGVDYGSGGSLSAISANAGFYSANFSASKLSVMGQGFVYYSSGTALPASTPIEVVPYDSFDSMRMGLFALPNSAPNVSGGLPQLGTDYGSLFTVGVSALKAATYSGVTVDGVNRINSSVTLANATYSAVTVRLDSYDYSSLVTVGVGTIKAASYSGVTVQGVTRINSSVTIADGLYSAVTTRLDLVAYSGATVGVGDIRPASYSGVSVEVKTAGIASTSFKASAVDAAALATDAGQEIADRVLLRALASGSDTGRSVQDALRPNRNRVQIGASIVTVYQEDDVTSAWTAAITTGTAASITDLDPAGP